jgi:hypothetical protein
MVMSGHMMALRRFALQAFLPLFAGTISQRGRSGSSAPLTTRSDGHYHKDRWLSRHPIGRSAPKRTHLQATPGEASKMGNGGGHLIDPLPREGSGERITEAVFAVLRHDRVTRIADRPADRS